MVHNNNIVTPILPMYINRNIITQGDMINEINFPTIAGGFPNNIVFVELGGGVGDALV